MLRALWPDGLLPVVIFLAALALGADQAAAGLVFSTVLLGLAALLQARPRAQIDLISLCWMAGTAVLFGLGLLNGWVTTGASEYASLMAGAGVFLTARNAARKPETAEAVWTLILILGAALGFAAFIDFLLDPRTLFGFERSYHFTRLSGPFLSANTAATVYGMIGLMSLASLLRALKRGGRVDARIQRLALPAAALLICATCLFLSGSRAGISLFMLSALALVVWDRLAAWLSPPSDTSARLPATLSQRLVRFLAAPGLLIVLGLVIFGLSGGLYAERIENAGLIIGDDARGVMFARYLDGIWLAPWFGAGLGGFAFVNDFLATAGDARTLTSQNAAHNIAFQWLMQTGFLGAAGAASVIALIASLLRKGLMRRRSQRLMLRTVIIIAVFVFAHGMVDYALEIPAAFWLFSCVLGLGAGLSEGGRSSRGRTHTPWPLKLVVIAALTLSAGLSLVAGLDRITAVRIAGLDDEQFISEYADLAALNGSAARLEAIGDRALRLETPNAPLARAAFLASLEQEPRNGKIWAKAAYATYTIIPVIAGETEDALRQSYYLLPYADRRFIQWRLSFMASVWDGLPDDLREAAERESRLLSGAGQRTWRRQVGLSAVPGEAGQPSG